MVVSAVCSCALLDGRLLLCLLGVCLLCCLFSRVLRLSSCLGFCGLLVSFVASIGWGCWFCWFLFLDVVGFGSWSCLVWRFFFWCGLWFLFDLFLVCSCGWSAVAVLGFVLVVSAVFVCLVNESSAGADANLFVYE
ncbi:hypothetical protein [Bifidobacterium catenulatum]|uniref:hypothetical protein n=1 Tax=Bifidobacterium catenulatum TaxID=1686 RepID=UPI003F8E5564